MTTYIEIINNKVTRSTSFEQIGLNYQNMITTEFDDYEINGSKYKYDTITNSIIDISQTPEYIAEQKKQKKNNAYKTYQEGLTQLKSEDELNQFLKSCGKITQTEYDNRLAIITTDLTTLQSTYLTEVADD